MTAENDDHSIKFSTYWNYVRHISYFLNNEYDDWREFGDQVQYKIRKLQGFGDFDKEWVRRFLRLAWNTEYLLNQGRDDSELLKLSTHWVPIQGYYCIYCASEPVGYALNGTKPESHVGALRAVSSYFHQSGLPPWCFGYKGSLGKSGKDHYMVNFPDNLNPDHNLRRKSGNPESIIAKCLKAEHQHRVDDKWESKSETGCWKYEYNPGETSLLHFFYRLRTKANYHDVDTFLAEVEDKRRVQFNQGIQKFVYWSLIYFELILIRKFQKQKIIDMGEEYLGKNSEATQLIKRLQLYQEIV